MIPLEGRCPARTKLSNTPSSPSGTAVSGGRDSLRERGLGSSEDSRRASEAWFRRLGAECGAVSATHAASRRPCQELADVLTESSRGDCRVRFLHGADSDIPAALLLFRDRAWAAPDSTLQCDGAPESGVGGTTTAGGFPRSGSVSICHLRSRLDVQRGSGHLPGGYWAESQTDERTSAVAEWHCGKMDCQCPPRLLRSCDRVQ